MSIYTQIYSRGLLLINITRIKIFTHRLLTNIHKLLQMDPQQNGLIRNLDSYKKDRTEVNHSDLKRKQAGRNVRLFAKKKRERRLFFEERTRMSITPSFLRTINEEYE